MKKELSFSHGTDTASITGTKKIKLVPIDDITVSDDFSGIFHVNESLVQSIAESMETDGFKPQFPLHVWKTEDSSSGETKSILIGGHTRLAAAKRAKLMEVYVQYLDLPNYEAARLAAYEDQIYRRNLSAADLLTAIEKYLEIGGGSSIKEMRKHLQSMTGMSSATCNRAIAISRDEQAKKDVADGATIGGAYADLMKRKRLDNEDSEEFDEDSDYDNSDNPSPLPSFDHGGHPDSYAPSRNDTPEEKARLEDIRKRESVASSQGKEDGFLVGFKAGLVHALYGIVSGQTVAEIYNAFSDFNSRDILTTYMDGPVTTSEHDTISNIISGDL